MLISRRLRDAHQVTKAVPGADCPTDHRLAIAKIRLTLKLVKIRIRNAQLNTDMLANYNETKEKLQHRS